MNHSNRKYEVFKTGSCIMFIAVLYSLVATTVAPSVSSTRRLPSSYDPVPCEACGGLEAHRLKEYCVKKDCTRDGSGFWGHKMHYCTRSCTKRVHYNGCAYNIGDIVQTVGKLKCRGWDRKENWEDKQGRNSWDPKNIETVGSIYKHRALYPNIWGTRHIVQKVDWEDKHGKVVHVCHEKTLVGKVETTFEMDHQIWKYTVERPYKILRGSASSGPWYEWKMTTTDFYAYNLKLVNPLGAARAFFTRQLMLQTKDIEFKNSQEAFVTETVNQIMPVFRRESAEPVIDEFWESFWKKHQKWVAKRIANKKAKPGRLEGRNFVSLNSRLRNLYVPQDYSVDGRYSGNDPKLARSEIRECSKTLHQPVPPMK